MILQPNSMVDVIESLFILIDPKNISRNITFHSSNSDLNRMYILLHPLLSLHITLIVFLQHQKVKKHLQDHSKVNTEQRSRLRVRTFAFSKATIHGPPSQLCRLGF
jgi:hypothetical protein